MEDVAIWIYSTDYWMGTNTDENGYYYLDLPNGTYSLDASKEGYEDTHFDNIEIDNDNITQDIYLVSIVNVDENEIAEIRLLQNYPNPFRTSTVISFSISNEQNQQNEPKTISIYNIKGQKIRTLEQTLEQTLECINHVDAKATKSLFHITWNGKDQTGKQVQSGIYFYKLKAGKSTFVKKLMLMK